MEQKMKYLLTAVCLCLLNPLVGADYKSHTTTPGSTPEVKPPPPSPPPQPQPPPPPRPKPAFVPASMPDQDHPGILIFKNGVWQETDYLFNLSSQIGIAIDILQPPNAKTALSQEKLRKIVEAAFGKAAISTEVLVLDNEPALPFFHIQIILYPVEKGFTAICEGRLFESVTVKRVILDRGTFLQAITWEKQTLLVAPSETFVAQVEKAVGEIADAFVDLFRTYQGLKGAKPYPIQAGKDGELSFYPL